MAQQQTNTGLPKTWWLLYAPTRGKPEVSSGSGSAGLWELDVRLRAGGRKERSSTGVHTDLEECECV